MVDHIYMLINNTTSSINIYTFTQTSSAGEVVETIKTNWLANETITFIPTQTAPAFRTYANANGTITIMDISFGIPKLEKDVFELQANASRTVYIDGNRQITEKNTTFFTQTANLYDKSTSQDYYSLNQYGTGVYDAPEYNTSDFINVKNINSVSPWVVSSVTVAVGIYYVLYDVNKRPLANRSITSQELNTEAAAFIRITIAKAQKDYFMLVSGGIAPSSYVNYGYAFLYGGDSKDPVKIYDTDDVIQKLLDNKGKNILFTAGSYDIIDIYESHFGSDYFTNYVDYNSGGDLIGRGLPIYRGTTVTFSQGAIFTAEYTGDNTKVPQNFAAFALESGVTIDGLRLYVSGIRNCIHDDFDNNTEGTTVIKNCHLSGNANIIAGGLGFHETVIIENCYIERSSGTSLYDFSYHNNGNTGAQSTLIIKDNYLARGFSVRWYGTSTLLTDVFVSNNSMANAVNIRAENENALIENINLKTWNNEIRTA